jgi:hypothetical protein
MIAHYLDFQVNRISVYRTSFWDDVRAVFDEVGKNREEILKAISDHSQNFSYDHSCGMDSEENREAAASLARWIRMLTENTKHAIEEDDLWIAFFSGEVKLQTPCQSAIGWDGKVYFIEFHVNDVVVESTQHHDTAWGAVSEAVRRKNDILAVLHCHTNALVFDDKQPDHAPKNRDAAERFDFWMSDFALFQFNPNCIEENEITVCLSCKDVVRKTDPFIMEMSA